MTQQRVSSEDWLSRNGLKARKIDLNSILPHLGFKHFDDFDPKIHKDVCSKYSENKFIKFTNRDGKVYNLIGNEADLVQYQSKLQNSLQQYQDRLHWATSGSYRVFGLVTSKKPVIILDIRTVDVQRRALYFNEVSKLLSEQISFTNSFNMVKDSSVLFAEETETSEISIVEATKWVDERTSTEQDGKAGSLIESLEKALGLGGDQIVIFTENGSTDDIRPQISSFVSNNKDKKFAIVAYNSEDRSTLEFLSSLMKGCGGDFHAFTVNETEEDSVNMTRSFFGSTPEGAPIDNDAFLLWNEVEEAKITIEAVSEMRQQVRAAKFSDEIAAKTQKVENESENRPLTLIRERTSPVKRNKEEALKRLRIEDSYLSSEQWLKKYGLEACHLDFYTFLSGHIFKHCNGVIDLKTEPEDEDGTYKTPADEKKVMVNAKYCKRFVHIVWKDGEIRHVQLTGSSYRDYTARTVLLLDKIQRRMLFLKEGSRELFGTICEDRIYVLIDTSASMETKIESVVKKLHLLLDEQIKDKNKFNIVLFNSDVTPWRTNLIDVTRSSIKQAKEWTRGIKTQGSTNTLDALKYAVSDKMTDGIYLLTDGRPDQPNKAIMSMLGNHPRIPIHSISFNCWDRDANDFLYTLSSETGGRFHIFQDILERLDRDGPRPHVSYDLTLLKQEYDRVKQNLKVVKKLRDECELLEKYKEPEEKPVEKEPEKVPKKKKKQRPPSGKKQRSASILSESSGLSETRKVTLRKKLKAETDEWMLQETKDLFEEERKMKRDAEEQLKAKEEQNKKPILLLEEKPEETIDKWIEKNSFVARKLTLMDFLGPTVVHHSAEYIPILGKHVTGKVFEEILPDFYVNTNNKDEIKFVNPQAVKLDDYDKKVKKHIKKLEKKLDELIWKSIPEESKHSVFHSEEPVSFFANKDNILKILEDNNWPIEEKHIDLLLEEIKQGKLFLQQSSNLKQKAESEKSDLSSDQFERFARSKPKNREFTDDDSLVNQATDRGKTCLNESRGLPVIARNDGDGFYYPASIVRNESKEAAYVRFNFTDSENLVPTKFLIPRAGAISGPSLMQGDFVLAHSMKDNTGSFQPGVLLAPPLPSEAQPKFYTVVLWNRKQVSTTRKFIVKISKERFQYTARYIKAKLDNPPEKPGKSDRKQVKKMPTQTFEEAENIVRLSKPANKYGAPVTPKEKKRPKRVMRKAPSPVKTSSRASESESSPDKEVKSKQRKTGKQRQRASSSSETESEPRSGGKLKDARKKRVNAALRNVSLSESDEASSELPEGQNQKSAPKDTPKRRPQAQPRNESGSESDSDSSSVSSSSEVAERGMQRSPTRLERREADRMSVSSSVSSSSSATLDGADGGAPVDISASVRQTTEPAEDESEDELIFNESNVMPSDDRPITPTPNDLAFGGNDRLADVSAVKQHPNIVLAETNDSIKDRFLLLNSTEERADFLAKELQRTMEEAEAIEEKCRSRVREQISALERLGASVEKHDYINTPSGMNRPVSKLQKGEEVLSKWGNDEWFYKNNVIQDMTKGYYAIKDAFDNMEILPRGEMICEEDDADQIIKKEDYVLAGYPGFMDERFGPAKVLEVDRENNVRVEFFEGSVAVSDRDKVFKIGFQRYASEVSTILEAMEALVGTPVVFKSEDSGNLQIGMLWDFDSQTKNRFVIRDTNSELVLVKFAGIFGPIRKSKQLGRGECVLAPSQEQTGVFIPATVVEIQEELVDVKVGSTRMDGVDKGRCVWVTRNQYSDLYRFYRHHLRNNSSA